ncbi:hypothetical protein SUGI_0491320 [Cryptomeria japonica]|nr:hypothetical protein SUGI_0491320 [Cryptomeria japonica]
MALLFSRRRYPCLQTTFSLRTAGSEVGSSLVEVGGATGGMRPTQQVVAHCVCRSPRGWGGALNSPIPES